MLIYNDTTVADVLKIQQFQGAELLAGEKGLKNHVNWIHPLEIWDDPNLWIDGGELIFCGAMGIDDPDRLTKYFLILLDIGIAGFCIQLHAGLKKIPAEMIDIAESHHCPLIVFNEHIRFIDLSRGLMNSIIKNVNYDYLKEKDRIDDNLWALDWVNGALSSRDISRYLKLSATELGNYSYFVIVIEYRKNSISYQWSEGIYLSTAKALDDLFSTEQFNFYPFFNNGLLTAVMVDYGNAERWKERYNKVVKTINLYTKDSEQKPFLIMAAGHRIKNPELVPKSFQTAVETLGICQKFQTNTFFYDELRMEFIYSLLIKNNDKERIDEFIIEQLGSLISFDSEYNGKLIETLHKFYENNGNKQLTAADLKIARPTLYYRLEQIKEILGHDPLDKDIRLTTEICLTFYISFMQKKNTQI